VTDNEVVIVEHQGNDGSGVESVPAEPEDECLKSNEMNDALCFMDAKLVEEESTLQM